jgi:H+/gluconate symporter-like permease
MQPEPEYAEIYTIVERVRIFIIGLVIGAGLVFVTKKWLFPSINEFALTAHCRTVFGIDGLTLLWYGLWVGIPGQALILVTATLGWTSFKIIRDRQFPPINQKVFKPTKICKGRKVIFIALLHFLPVVLMLALTIWGAYQADKMSQILHPKNDLCLIKPVI